MINRTSLFKNLFVSLFKNIKLYFNFFYNCFKKSMFFQFLCDIFEVDQKGLTQNLSLPSVVNKALVITAHKRSVLDRLPGFETLK